VRQAAGGVRQAAGGSGAGLLVLACSGAAGAAGVAGGTGPAASSYDVDAAFMLLQVHDRGIHAV
jgi:hypothetical protein